VIDRGAARRRPLFVRSSRPRVDLAVCPVRGHALRRNTNADGTRLGGHIETARRCVRSLRRGGGLPAQRPRNGNATQLRARRSGATVTTLPQPIHPRPVAKQGRRFRLFGRLMFCSRTRCPRIFLEGRIGKRGRWGVRGEGRPHRSIGRGSLGRPEDRAFPVGRKWNEKKENGCAVQTRASRQIKPERHCWRGGAATTGACQHRPAAPVMPGLSSTIRRDDPLSVSAGRPPIFPLI